MELSALLMADFDISVHAINAQPFQLTALVGDRQRRHVPDYLLRTDSGPVVVDVVRARRLMDPKIQALCAWTRQVVESRSWTYQVVSEQPPVVLGNVRFLAGYRRERFVDGGVLNYLRGCAAQLIGMRIDDVPQGVAETIPPALIRAALMHLLWRQEFHVDLTVPLAPSTLLKE